MNADPPAQRRHGESGADSTTRTPANAALVQQDRQIQQPIENKPMLPAHAWMRIFIVLAQPEGRLPILDPIGQRHHKIGQPRVAR
jgi:hypothetical protein